MSSLRFGFFTSILRWRTILLPTKLSLCKWLSTWILYWILIESEQTYPFVPAPTHRTTALRWGSLQQDPTGSTKQAWITSAGEFPHLQQSRLEDKLLSAHKSRTFVQTRTGVFARSWVSEETIWHVLRHWWVLNWSRLLRNFTEWSCAYTQAMSSALSTFVSGMWRVVGSVLFVAGTRSTYPAHVCS